jgi:hypothetical protein
MHVSATGLTFTAAGAASAPLATLASHAISYAMSDVIVPPAPSPVAANPRAAFARLAVASVAIALVTFALEGWPILLPPLTALALAIWTRYAARRISCPRSRRRWRAFGLLLILASVGLFVAALHAGRERLKATIVRDSDLRDVGMVLKLYSDELNNMPASLADLVLEGVLIVGGETFSMCDPRGTFVPCPYDFSQPIPVSYVYRALPISWPGDPEFVVAHDPWAYTALAWRLPPPRGYAVLFADGRVALLRPSEFEQALAADRAHRVARGWPADPPPAPNRYMEPPGGWQPPPGWVPPEDWPWRTPAAPGAPTAPATTAPASQAAASNPPALNNLAN